MMDTTEMGDLYDGSCEAGCKSFHGGEKKHHPDCGHYPESLTKMNADRIEELEAKLADAEADRRFILEERDRTFALMLARAEAAEAALVAVYRLALEDAADVAEYAGAVRMQSDGSYSHHEAVMGPTVACDVLALRTPTAAELMARIKEGEK